MATLSQRLVALMIDAAFMLGVAALALLPGRLAHGDVFDTGAGFMHRPVGASTSGQLGFAALELLLLMLAWTVYAGLLSARGGARRGQTFGKQAAGIQAARRSGAPISARTAWLRAALLAALVLLPVTAGTALDAALSTAPALSDAGFALSLVLVGATGLAALGRKQRRTLHDRLAGTIVTADPARDDAPVWAESPGWFWLD